MKFDCEVPWLRQNIRALAEKIEISALPARGKAPLAQLAEQLTLNHTPLADEIGDATDNATDHCLLLGNDCFE
jgi:hypothetical protein